MFENAYLSPSGVRIHTSLAHNLAGIDLSDTDDPQVQDALRKYGERGRALLSENSEDALTWSFFHAMSKLPTKQWLLDFFRAAVSQRFAKAYAPHIDNAQVRFWVPHTAPKIYLQWLGAKLLKEGEAAFKHLENYDARVRAKERLEKIMQGDPTETPERPTEVDCEIRIGNQLLVFIEAKLYSDATASGTFSPGRNQILRNMELVDDVARREGFKDARFILLTMDRGAKIYTKAMKRYRGSDMRSLRNWDEVGRWELAKRDLPHRADEPDEYFKQMTQRMGWLVWPECLKLLAHHATLQKGPCEP
ncbi:MAG TPA: hypothetical protein DCZ01_03745 [Elusimicrobia bacterium]|nr:MAG: hypothetical protein A2X37_06000 [Elusimicrobia bacterium GWA2_66_18]OGR70633.1 MAG: hypothetical protein A2X40_07680 [Elusimicrobia bacterium GWC2_65_9]HAZ07641.1 hypothetical protein [Elusimicrobiota bacterium]